MRIASCWLLSCRRHHWTCVWHWFEGIVKGSFIVTVTWVLSPVWVVIFAILAPCWHHHLFWIKTMVSVPGTSTEKGHCHSSFFLYLQSRRQDDNFIFKPCLLCCCHKTKGLRSMKTMSLKAIWRWNSGRVPKFVLLILPSSLNRKRNNGWGIKLAVISMKYSSQLFCCKESIKGWPLATSW